MPPTNPKMSLEELQIKIAEQIGLITQVDPIVEREKLLNTPISELIRDSLDLLDLGLQIENFTGIEVTQEQLNNQVNAKQLAELLMA
jgi:acyl carrier protein